MYDLSIILPTCNRAELLGRALESIRQSINKSCEIIVVDGASTDCTHDVLMNARHNFGDDLKIIREESRRGFVAAANEGFRAAVGRNMIWLNDDVRPAPGSLDKAIEQIDAAPADVGFLAMYHRTQSQNNVAYEATYRGKPYRLCHVRGTLYANFPIGRRQTFERLGYFSEEFYFYGADPDLSLKAWNVGLRVAPATGVFLDHDEHADDRRLEDQPRGKADNVRLFGKWLLPPKNPSSNDFDPEQPNTLRGPRPRVSFVISTYNRKDVLIETLNHVREAQIRSGVQCQTIVIDNASTDGTLAAIADLSKDHAVQPIACPKNLGPCAKNLGIAQAEGEFIVFLDDDSWPDHRSISNLIQHFENDPLLGCAIFEALLPDGSRECSAYPSVFIGCGSAFRTCAIRSVGGLPEDFFMAAEEYDLSLKLLDAAWKIEKFDDLTVEHRKAPGARFPARITRLDVRNNLLVIIRYFPIEWVLPFAIDWMRRYQWIARTKGWRHNLAYWHGLAGGVFKSLNPRNRRPISPRAFEQFAMIEQIEIRMRDLAENGVRRILLLDVGKNIYPFFLAAKSVGLEIVAIADPRLAYPRRTYRGVPVLNDADARAFRFDAAIIANVSPVHVEHRRLEWRKIDGRPVYDIFQGESRVAAALAA